jgi:hypothetical protein
VSHHYWHGGQIEAFDDTWHWGNEAERAFDEVIRNGNTDTAELLRALRAFLKENDMMAYLCMMAIRLSELHRVLKPTGCLYLHCDPTASHYLKMLMDSAFRPQNFRNEIIWQRTSAHANVVQKFGAVHDVLLFYTKGDEFTWNQQYIRYTPEYIEMFFDQADEYGKRYFRRDLTASMSRASSGQLYEWKGIRPPPSRCWAMAKDRMDELEARGIPEPSDRSQSERPAGPVFMAASGLDLRPESQRRPRRGTVWRKCGGDREGRYQGLPPIRRPPRFPTEMLREGTYLVTGTAFFDDLTFSVHDAVTAHLVAQVNADGLLRYLLPRFAKLLHGWLLLCTSSSAFHSLSLSKAGQPSHTIYFEFDSSHKC